MGFEHFESQKCGGLLVSIFSVNYPQENRLKFVTRNITTFFMTSTETFSHMNPLNQGAFSGNFTPKITQL